MAERADLIVDFANVPVGGHVPANIGPDEPYGGGEPCVDFPVADPDSTGQVMEFRVVPSPTPYPTTPTEFLKLPAITPLPPATVTRPLALLEEMSGLFEDAPGEALLGTIDGDPNLGQATWAARPWEDPVTENPAVASTEVWERRSVSDRRRRRRTARHREPRSTHRMRWRHSARTWSV